MSLDDLKGKYVYINWVSWSKACEAIESVSENFKKWQLDYRYNTIKNEFIHDSHSITEKNSSRLV